MKGNNYWRKRFEMLEQSQFNSSTQVIDDIAKSYRSTERELKKQLNEWYARFASNNGVTVEEAHKLLTSGELKELKWDVKEYIKKGKNNIDGRFTKELENASAKFHITRLEAIELQSKMQVNELLGKTSKAMDGHLYDVYSDGYYRTAYEIQKGTGVGYNLNQLDNKKVENVLKKPWTTDGRTFSDRIWQNKEQLVNNLHKSLTKMCVMGENPDVIAKEMSKSLGTSYSQTARLVRTEASYFSSLSTKDCYKDIGVEEFEVSAILDSKTSEICFNMDGKHFPMSQYEVGITAPPFHPNCRSCTVPYFDDDLTPDFAKSKIAKDSNGRKYEIPQDMSYKEWRNTYVDESSSKGKVDKIKEMYDRATRNDPPITLAQTGTKYYDDIQKAIGNAEPTHRKLLEKYESDITYAKTNCRATSRSTNEGIYCNLADDAKSEKGAWSTLFHENGHKIDSLGGNISESKQFVQALKNDYSSFMRNYGDYLGVNYTETCKVLSKSLVGDGQSAKHSLSDLLNCLSNGDIKGAYRHPADYWKNKKKLPHEAFAHFFSANCVEDKGSLEALKYAFPTAFQEYEILIKGLL